LIDGDRMPGARWFPDASLNYAQNLLERRRPDDHDDALVFWGEDKVRRRISHADVRTTASRVAAALKAEGIKPSDRIAAYLPKLPSVKRVVVVPYLQQTPRASDIRAAGPSQGANYAPSGGSAAATAASVGAHLDLSSVRGGVGWDDFLAPHAGGAIDYPQLPFD